MNHVAIDDYVLDVLMPDLAGHDHSPAAVLVYLALWSDDVEATARELIAKGVEFVMAPKKEHYGTTSIFKDIDGNAIVLSSR